MNIVERASKKIDRITGKYYPAHDVYWIEMGRHGECMQEHPAMKSYCEKCIIQAVDDARRKYLNDRAMLMGHIYEYQQSGFYTVPAYSEKKMETYGKKIRDRKLTRDQMLRQMRADLRKKLPARLLFSYRYTNGSCGEHDDFEHCHGCGVIFEQAVLLTDEELEHWAGLSAAQMRRAIKNPQDAYCLQKILSLHSFGIAHQKAIEALAKRIIDAAREASVKISITKQN
jgi:hypothetical protein